MALRQCTTKLTYWPVHVVTDCERKLRLTVPAERIQVAYSGTGSCKKCTKKRDRWLKPYLRKFKIWKNRR